MRLERRLRGMQDETGQVFFFLAVAMVVLIGIVGFAVDVGHAYLVQRQLQAGVDAAALAGAQELPDSAAATAAANAYSPSRGSSLTGKNAVTAVDNARTNVSLDCVSPGCSKQSPTFSADNAVRVNATSDVSTYFARVLGINTLTVHADATACSPCAAKPLDIMIALDRTGSMCDVANPNGTCRDETNATNGVKTFLGFMDPSLDEVGLAVFPPSLEGSCATPFTKPNPPPDPGKRYGYDAFWPAWTLPANSPLRPAGVYAIASPDFNFLIQTGSGWQLNPASNLVQKLNSCVKPAGTTSYSNAIAEAQHELDVHGRGNVRDVIIFLSDGAANTTPRNVPGYIDNAYDRARPCGSGIKAANNVKGSGTLILTIGYDVDADANGGQCGAEGLTAQSTLTQMASPDPSSPNGHYFYNQPDPVALGPIFTQIARDLSRPASRLIG